MALLRRRTHCFRWPDAGSQSPHPRCRLRRSPVHFHPTDKAQTRRSGGIDGLLRTQSAPVGICDLLGDQTLAAGTVDLCRLRLVIHVGLVLRDSWCGGRLELF